MLIKKISNHIHNKPLEFLATKFKDRKGIIVFKTINLGRDECSDGREIKLDVT